jgi:hypothetical protein
MISDLLRRYDMNLSFGPLHGNRLAITQRLSAVVFLGALLALYIADRNLKAWWRISNAHPDDIFAMDRIQNLNSAIENLILVILSIPLLWLLWILIVWIVWGKNGFKPKNTE